MLIRTVGAFGGEPCLVLDEDDDGLHIAYTGHSGMKAEALGYWMVDHGAYEVVVPREEVFSIRVERIPSRAARRAAASPEPAPARPGAERAVPGEPRGEPLGRVAPGEHGDLVLQGARPPARRTPRGS